MPTKKKIPEEAQASDPVETATAKIRRPRKPNVTAEAGSARRTSTRRKSRSASVPGSPNANLSESALEEALKPAVSEYEQVALLAYSFWEARGRQGGSSEEDWYRAEREVRRLRETRSK